MQHTKLEYPICQNGFKTKTINIRTQAGKTKFLLQQVNELGLPHDAQILAFWCREHVSTITSSNGLTLTTAAVFDNAYISLKDRAKISFFCLPQKFQSLICYFCKFGFHYFNDL